MKLQLQQHDSCHSKTAESSGFPGKVGEASDQHLLPHPLARALPAPPVLLPTAAMLNSSLTVTQWQPEAEQHPDTFWCHSTNVLLLKNEKNLHTYIYIHLYIKCVYLYTHVPHHLVNLEICLELSSIFYF